MTLYEIPIKMEIIADSKDEAENYICKILDDAFIYGCGLSTCTEQDREPGTDVVRLFDWNFMED